VGGFADRHEAASYGAVLRVDILQESAARAAG
jgi:hypothetical protein